MKWLTFPSLLVLRLWEGAKARLMPAEPPCVDRCAGYGTVPCTCADIDAWTTH